MKSNPPIIIEATRGAFVESTHAVDAIVADAGGSLISAYGDHELALFPRSAIKSLQALPMMESGAADELGLEDKHLALCCASHNAQDIHVDGATEILAKAGLDGTCLECGEQLPRFPEDQAKLVKAGIKPQAVHNNCSGKHAGFLAFAAHAGFKTKGYINFEHPVQQEIANTLEAITGAKHGSDNYAIDGCSIPTFKIPLSDMAKAYAKFSVGEDTNPTRSKAMIRLRDACMKHPEMVAGDKRACTKIMKALPNRAFVKVGAEGVYSASLPELGIGIAMKARDGNFRAVEVAVASMVADLLELNNSEIKALAPLINPVLKNWNGIEVGGLRSTT